MIHEGPHVRAMEAKGIRTALGNLNRLISQFNQMVMEITVLKSWISEKIYELKADALCAEANAGRVFAAIL